MNKRKYHTAPLFLLLFFSVYVLNGNGDKLIPSQFFPGGSLLFIEKKASPEVSYSFSETEERPEGRKYKPRTRIKNSEIIFFLPAAVNINLKDWCLEKKRFAGRNVLLRNNIRFQSCLRGPPLHIPA